MDAAFETSGVFANGKFHADQFLKVYENGLNNTEERNLWRPVIQKSIARCEACGE